MYVLRIQAGSSKPVAHRFTRGSATMSMLRSWAFGLVLEYLQTDGVPVFATLLKEGTHPPEIVLLISVTAPGPKQA